MSRPKFKSVDGLPGVVPENWGEMDLHIARDLYERGFEKGQDEVRGSIIAALGIDDALRNIEGGA